MPEVGDYKSQVENQWCPGCPNFGILAALKRALVELKKEPHEICLVSGIGQAAKLPHYLKCNVFNGLHGRAIPIAIGINVANPALKTIVTTGDGDCYGEGGNHFLHALRRNPDITVIVHNNRVYALTKGQSSPTTPTGEPTRLQFGGVELAPAQPLATAIVHGCTFVARGFAGEMDHLSRLLAQAISHRGLSIVDVIQPCITWGTKPVSWYKERIEILDQKHDPTDSAAALELAMERKDRIPIGLLYKTAPRPLFAAGYRERVGNRPLAELPNIGKGIIEERLNRLKE
jgi:2-oxoglutarate ferredoxin oxidoreductase subunit beta